MAWIKGGGAGRHHMAGCRPAPPVGQNPHGPHFGLPYRALENRIQAPPAGMWGTWPFSCRNVKKTGCFAAEFFV